MLVGNVLEPETYLSDVGDHSLAPQAETPDAREGSTRQLAYDGVNNVFCRYEARLEE